MSAPKPLIADELLAEAKAAAKRSGQSLRSYVSGAVRCRIQREDETVRLTYEDMVALENELRQLQHSLEELLPTVVSAVNSTVRAQQTKQPAILASGGEHG